MSEDRSTNTYGSTREKYMSCGAFILDQWIAGSQFDMKKNPDFVLEMCIRDRHHHPRQ